MSPAFLHHHHHPSCEYPFSQPLHWLPCPTASMKATSLRMQGKMVLSDTKQIISPHPLSTLPNKRWWFLIAFGMSFKVSSTTTSPAFLFLSELQPATLTSHLPHLSQTHDCLTCHLLHLECSCPTFYQVTHAHPLDTGKQLFPQESLVAPPWSVKATITCTDCTRISSS